jgi:hypothetical protein
MIIVYSAIFYFSGNHGGVEKFVTEIKAKFR